jgi:hypothetical protein
MTPSARVLSAAIGALPLIVLGARGEAQSSLTIEKLLTDGWEVAGYIAAWENRSLILFKHKDQRHLMQCSVLIDVLRNPRVVTTCYEVK